MADLVMSEVFPGVRDDHLRRRAHEDEVEISERLLRRPRVFVATRRKLFVVLAAGGDNSLRHTYALRDEAIEHAVTVIELVVDLAGFARDREMNQQVFRPV